MTPLTPYAALTLSQATLGWPTLVDRVAPPLDVDLLGQYGVRDYQEDMLRRLAHLMSLGYRRILIQVATGAGKTVTAAALLGVLQQRGYWSQFLVHRKELVDQTSDTFGRLKINHGFIAADREISFDNDVTIAGIQTLVNRLSSVQLPDFVVVDEAQHSTSASWTRVLRHYRDAFIIGLSATPERLDGRGLDEHFDIMIPGPSVADLIAWGYLSPFDYFAPNDPDLEGVRTLGGDFERSGTERVMDQATLTGDIVEHYLRHAKGQQGIGFAVTREHSRHIVDAFKGNGVRAEHIDGEMGREERKWLMDAFRAGDVELLSNVELFGEGLDVPGIVYCGLWRPTKSISLHRQQAGRALRVLKGKEKAIICDHAGNALRLSDLPDTEREWSLEGRKGAAKKAAGPKDALPIRQCLVCYQVSYSTAGVCGGCGTEFPRREAEPKQVDGQLTKLEKMEAKARLAAERKQEEKACKNYADYFHLALKRGYAKPEGWARLRANMQSDYARRFR